MCTARALIESLSIRKLKQEMEETVKGQFPSSKCNTTRRTHFMLICISRQISACQQIYQSEIHGILIKITILKKYEIWNFSLHLLLENVSAHARKWLRIYIPLLWYVLWPYQSATFCPFHISKDFFS